MAVKGHGISVRQSTRGLEMRKLILEILVLSVVAFGVLWLLSPPANAQEWRPGSASGVNWQCPIPKANPAGIRIAVDEGAGLQPAGSGAVFRQERKIAYILTAAHVVKDRKKNDSHAVVVYANDGAFYATVLACDKTWDVAILRISDPKVKPLALADNPPKPGDSVECNGFSNGVYRYARGPMTQFVAPGKDLPFEWMEVKVASRPGDSGGPIVNTKGRIVGLINGTDGRITAGPCLPRIRKIVDGLLGRRPPSLPLRGRLPTNPVIPVIYPPSLPEPLPVVPPVMTEIDYDKLAVAVLKQINPDDFRGPVGPAGLAGLSGRRGPRGALGTSGPTGPQGPSGSYSDLSEEEMLDLANRIKKLINGSVRVKVDKVLSK